MALRPRTALEDRIVQEGHSAAEVFPLPAVRGSEVMMRPCLYCARCGTEIPSRHIAWQISRWPAAVDIRALGGCTHCRIGTRLRLRWYADGRLEGPQRGTTRWVRYQAISPQHRLYKHLTESLRLLFGAAPRH